MIAQMICVQELLFSYPHSDFQLQIPQLEIDAECATAVVGPSGSGKTTLLHLVAGILSPERGNITVDGINVAALSSAGRRSFRLRNIGMVFQDFELIEYLNVLDNVLLPCRIGRLSLDSDAKERAVHLLQLVGMSRHIKKSVTRLSQGERQRVAICRGLLSKPSLLLADEPTGNLDPATSEQILDVLLETVQVEKSTLVMVTHDHSLLHRFASTIDFTEFLTQTFPATADSTQSNSQDGGSA